MDAYECVYFIFRWILNPTKSFEMYHKSAIANFAAILVLITGTNIDWNVRFSVLMFYKTLKYM